MMPLGADPGAPTTEEAPPADASSARDGVAVGALAVFAVSLPIAGFLMSAALGFVAVALAALVVAILIGLQ